ncbi:MAG: hypothetical protein L0Z50_41050, partial [Verrucomicrobiales bacterium]|nr:hypothetical protein [Verrucomicrobiales bacterium]
MPRSAPVGTPRTSLELEDVPPAAPSPLNGERAGVRGETIVLRAKLRGRVNQRQGFRLFAGPLLLLVWAVLAALPACGSLPGDYFPVLSAGIDRIAKRLEAEPQASLATLESAAGWRHFPSA